MGWSKVPGFLLLNASLREASTQMASALFYIYHPIFLLLSTTMAVRDRALPIGIAETRIVQLRI